MGRFVRAGLDSVHLCLIFKALKGSVMWMCHSNHTSLSLSHQCVMLLQRNDLGCLEELMIKLQTTSVDKENAKIQNVLAVCCAECCWPNVAEAAVRNQCYLWHDKGRELVEMTHAVLKDRLNFSLKGIWQPSHLHGQNAPVSFSRGRQEGRAHRIRPANQRHSSQRGIRFPLPTGWHGRLSSIIVSRCWRAQPAVN